MAASSAKITYAEDLGYEVVSVYVGPGRKRYVVHKQLLTSQSDYFDKALNGKFREAEENEIHLEEDDPTAIGLMIGWLYRGVIPGTGKKASPFTRALAGSSETYLLRPPPFPEHGTSAPFTPFLATDLGGNPNNTDAYVNICCFSRYENFSQEELRLSDYRLNRKFASNAPAPPQTTAPVPNTVGNTTTATGLSIFRGSSTFRAPNSGWGVIMPQLPGAQPPTAPVGQTTGLFGSLTSGAQPSILQTPLPPQPSLFSSPSQSVFQTDLRNVSMPTTNPFAPLRSSSVSGTMGSTGSSIFNVTGASSPSTSGTPGTPGLAALNSASPSGTVRTTGPSIFSPAGAPSVGATSSIFNLSGAPSGSGTIRNTGLSMFGNFPAAGPAPNPKPAPKKPGEFGYSPTINYPKPDGSFIKGIPRSEPLGDLMVDEFELQDALLHLCIFAETVCWPKLFNTAIDAYMLGELNLRRDILLEHVDLIYNRTHPDSTLRAFVMDSIRRLTSPDSYKTYMELAQQHEDFLENLLKAVSLGLAKDDKPSAFDDRKKSYFMSEEPFAPPKKAFADNHEDEVL